MNLDFIKTPYTTAPSMTRNHGPIRIESPSREVIEQKKIELERYSEDLWAQADDMQAVVARAARICGVFCDNIVDLALMVEEDVAVMHQGRLAAICFCFPSGFVPRKRIGLTLSEIHRPVADNTLLVNASPGIARVMTEQASFRRSVWTVTQNPDLSNHPSNRKTAPLNSWDDLYFRREIQTTARVDSETSLFFVKVDVCPLRTVWDTRILDSINSMSDAVLDYKNLREIKHFLNTNLQTLELCCQ